MTWLKCAFRNSFTYWHLHCSFYRQYKTHLRVPVLYAENENVIIRYQTAALDCMISMPSMDSVQAYLQVMRLRSTGQTEDSNMLIPITSSNICKSVSQRPAFYSTVLSMVFSSRFCAHFIVQQEESWVNYNLTWLFTFHFSSSQSNIFCCRILKTKLYPGLHNVAFFFHKAACFPVLLNIIKVMMGTRHQNGAIKCM